MTIRCIEKLLKENDTALLRERRAADRKPFARPVTITTGRNQKVVHEAFSKDISTNGIALISRENWSDGSRVALTIHTLTDRELARVTAEARWTKPFGNGWYLTGWRFLAETKLS